MVSIDFATTLTYVFIPVNLASHENGQQQRMGMQEQESGNPAVIVFSI